MIMVIIVLFILAAIFYWGLIKGNFFPPLLFIFAILGGRIIITKYFPASAATIMTFMGFGISYASFIAALVAIMGIGYYINED